jgi:hypothetical protein
MAEVGDIVGLALDGSKAALTIINYCIGYVDTVKDRKKELRCIIIEISQVKSALDIVQALVQADPDDTAALKDLDGEDGSIQGCLSALEELKSIFSDGSSEAQRSQNPTSKGNLWRCFRMECIFGPSSLVPED